MHEKPDSNLKRSRFSEPMDEGLDFWGMLCRRKWLVIPTLLLGVGLAYAKYTQEKPVFESTSTILVQNSSKNVGVGGLDGNDGNATDMQTQIVLIRSPRIVGRAMIDHDLSSLSSLSGYPNPMQEIVAHLAAFHREDTQGVLNLSYLGPNSDDCRVILQAVVESYGKLLREAHRNINEETVELISNAKDELLQQLNTTEAEYREFKRTAPPVIVDDGQANNIHRTRLASIEQQRSALLLERTNLRGQIQAIETARKTGHNEDILAVVVGNMKMQSELGQPKTVAEQLFPLMLQEQMELQRLGPDHPRVKNIRHQIDLTKKFLDGLVPLDSGDAGSDQPTDFLSVYVASLQQKVKINEDQEAELNKQFEIERQAARKYLDVEAQHAVFQDDIGRKKALFNALVQRLGEMDVLGDFGGYTMQVVTAASAGLQIGPSVVRHLGVGALLGFLIGVVIAYWREKSDKRFRAPEDICDQIGASVVGHIPAMPLAKRKDGKPWTIDPAICTFHQPQSHFAEAYRAVRVALYFSTQGKANKIIQITSPSPGDGKSTLAANLAVSIANSGKRVVLVEGDFRRPRVHEIFRIHSEIGMPAVIRGDAELTEALHETIVENLWCIPCGKAPETPAELLASERFGHLLEALRERFDYVIVDTPPVLAVTDPCTVAARVDGVYITMRLKKNSRATASRAAEMLESTGGKLLGVVVNGAGRSKRYGYGHANYKTYRGDNYGPSRYGYYGYGASLKEAEQYYGAANAPALNSREDLPIKAKA